MKGLRVLGLLLLLLAVLPLTSSAEVGSWGVGAFLDYNVPTRGFAQWYGSGTKWGITGSYVPSEMVTVEAEFHREEMKGSELKTATFTWNDGKAYTSPNVNSDMTINSLLLNAIVRLAQKGEAFQASSFAPYVAVGGGFYRYKNTVSGLLWPLQKDALVIEMEPFTDQRFALGFNAGLGVEAFIIKNVAVDLRARYNMMIGDLRPLEDWEISETFPLQAVDIGAGLKLYFGGE
jgi:opacity protein-like surface antigen